MQMSTEAWSDILCEAESVASGSLLVFKWIFLCMCARLAQSVEESIGAWFLPSLDFISTVCYCCSGNFPSMQTGNSPRSSNGSQILKSFRSDFCKLTALSYLQSVTGRAAEHLICVTVVMYVCLYIKMWVFLNVHCLKWESVLHAWPTLETVWR